MASLPVLTTDRLTLRPLAREDGAALHAAFSDPEVMKYWSGGPHETLEQTLDYAAENAAGDPYATWAITEAGGEALGWVTLGRERPGVAEIGFILRRDRWGRGYGGEAAQAVLAHGFAEMGLHRVFADIDPDNAASIGVVVRLGFRLEGRLRQAWKTHIGLRDSLIYGFLRDEYRT